MLWKELQGYKYGTTTFSLHFNGEKEVVLVSAVAVADGISSYALLCKRNIILKRNKSA